MTKIASVIVALLLLSLYSARADQISIVTVEWPPYFSKSEQHEGFMSQIVYRVMQEANLSGRIEFT